MATETEALVEQLDSFDPSTRKRALTELASTLKDSYTKKEVNLHFHTFYSFNAEGWSPSRVAWEARKYGLEIAGKVDFDVLEGMEEFLEAGEILGIKTVSGLETRVFIKEYSDKVINSPGEPGIAYFMAEGCYKRPDSGSDAENTLAALYNTARSRTEELMDRVNTYLSPVSLDFRKDVLSLTPGENATERHLLAAYEAKGKEVHPDKEAQAAFWSEKLGTDAGALIDDSVKLQETMRSKLMKLGGVAYVQPDSGSFPTVEEVIAMAKGMGAIACATWLDGTTPGEANMEVMLELLLSKGVAAVNIIPDRNWNIKNPDEKALKLKKLEEVVLAARKFHMPICVGTEMNKKGLPFVDDFSALELQPYIEDFLEGARFFWGHTLMARKLGIGYYSKELDEAYGAARVRRNKFFNHIGRLPLMPESVWKQLEERPSDPETVMAYLQKQQQK